MWAARSFFGLRVEQELDHPVGVARDLPAGVVLEAGAADLVVDALLLELLLGGADRGDLRDRVDAVRQDRRDRGLVADVERVTHGHAALLHGRGGQGGEPDHVADGVDPGNGRAEVFVHPHVAALGQRDAQRLEVQAPRVSGPPRGEEKLVGPHPPPRFELEAQRVGSGAGLALDRFDGIPQEDLRAHPLEGQLDHGRELLVDARQQAVAALDQHDLGAQRGEEAGVLGSDHAAAHDRQRRRHAVEVQDAVAVDHVRIARGDAARRRRRGTRGDQEHLGAQSADDLPLRIGHGDRLRVLEGGGARDQRDRVAVEVTANLPRLPVRDVLQAAHQLAQALLAVQPQAHSVELAAPESRQVQRGLAQRLGGERPGVDRRAADVRRALDQGHALAEVGRLGGALFACRGRSRSRPRRRFRGAGTRASLRPLCPPASPAGPFRGTWHIGRLDCPA